MNEPVRRVLVAEDDATLRDVLETELTKRGFAVVTASRGDHVLARAVDVDVVLLDERLPEMNGLRVLRALRDEGNPVPVVFLTGHGDVELAVEALRAGAFHFLTKPCDLSDLVEVLGKAVERTGGEAAPGDGARRLIGSGEAMTRTRDLLHRIAGADAPVLITGESGTGKELAARCLHREGPRAAGPFLALNCAALQDTLVEAELFGHERGAFTGADRAKEGMIEEARGGILFLDEIGELSATAQAKLLRVLHEGTYRRVGSTEERRSDVRLVAATNVDLPEAIAAGRFRQDLFFRLNVLAVRLPPLREHAEDIPELVEHFHARHGVRSPKDVTEQVHQRLRGYGWPGNVRELFNVLDRVRILSDPGTFDAAIVDHYLAMAGQEFGLPAVPDRLDELEMMQIHRILDRCGGNKTQAARILGISLKTLYNKLNREGESR